MLKRNSHGLRLCLAAMALALALPFMPGAGSVTAYAAEKSGLTKENGRYYFYRSGKAVTKKWKTIKKNTYYFGEDGAAVTGWKTLKKGRKYNVFYFNKKGIRKPKKTAYIDQKSVHKIVKKTDAALKKLGITAETDKEQELQLLFDYMTTGTTFRYGRDMTPKKPRGWEYKYAAAMLSKHTGSCYHYAAAYAFMARRATGLPVRVCIGKSKVFNAGAYQPHAWTEIKLDGAWYIFDTNAARYSKRTNLVFFKLKASDSAARSDFKASKKVTVRF